MTLMCVLHWRYIILAGTKTDLTYFLTFFVSDYENVVNCYISLLILDDIFVRKTDLNKTCN